MKHPDIPMKEIILLLRPQQWLKNTFVFLPLFFHGDLTNVSLLCKAFLAFVCYSFAASAVYCFNDIYDVDADRKHPTKCKRPIAAGKVSQPQAYGLMAAAFALSVIIATCTLGDVALATIGVISCYFILNIAYCIRLKHFAIVDMFVIAIGFVLRIFVGGIVTSIVLSQWIVLMTFLLALFLAFLHLCRIVTICKQPIYGRIDVYCFAIPFHVAGVRECDEGQIITVELLGCF